MDSTSTESRQTRGVNLRLTIAADDRRTFLQHLEPLMLTNDLITALIAAVDSKLATTDALTLEELEHAQRLVQARVALESMAASHAR